MDAEAFVSFLRWTESKMVRMVEEFEKSDQSASVRPWPQRVTFRDPVWPYAQAVFVGLRFHYEKADKVNEKFCFDLRQPVVQFVDEVTFRGQQ